MPRPTAPRVALVAAAVVVLLTTAAACSSPASAPAAPASPTVAPDDPVAGAVTVPLTLDGPRLIIPIEVGGTLLHVKVDTGSSGLRVNADRVPPGAVRTVGPAGPMSFESGVALTGTVAETTIGVGTARSTTPTPIELVTGTHCVADHPDCARGAHRWDGILGLSAKSAPVVGNPLWSLGPVGHSYAIHVDPAGTSSLVLEPSSAGFTLEKLTPEPAPGAGAPGTAPPASWDDAAPACVSTPTFSAPVCGPTVFDTGRPDVASLPASAAAGRVPAGTQVTVAAPDHGWSTTMTTARAGGVSVAPGRAGGDGRSACGLPVIEHLDLRYDLDAGTLGFRPR